MINKENYKCRVCDSANVKIFKLKHFVFNTKNNNWKSFFCSDCGAISDFNILNKKTDYKKGDYRKHDPLIKNLNKEFENVFPPISSWSSITFARWRAIWKLLQKKTNLFKKEIKMLDYGGYNGFLPYALKQKHKIISWVADFDPKGLKFAKLLGSKIINLSKNNFLKKNFFNLVSVVHVLEHMDNPGEQLRKINKCLKSNGIIYIEVPNLYCFPLGDTAHLIAFTHYSLYMLVKKSGFKILNYGFGQTPKESIAFNYYYNNKKENIYIIAIKTEKKINEMRIPDKIIPSNIQILKYKIQSSYANIMLFEISLTLIKQILKYCKTFILFFFYGLIEFFSLKIFKNSLINKYKN